MAVTPKSEKLISDPLLAQEPKNIPSLSNSAQNLGLSQRLLVTDNRTSMSEHLEAVC